VIDHLNQNRSVRTLELSNEEIEQLKPYSFLTEKKMLYIANLSEEDLSNPSDNPYFKKVVEHAKQENSEVIPICAKLEEELAQFSPEEAKEFLKPYNLEETGLNRLTKTAFKLLGLITFLTTGEVETRAWTITTGTNAQHAAGKIHTDIQKGFIRAEVVSFNDMVQYKGRVGAKESGKARAEGKEYIVKDGDVILFFHNA